MVNSSTFSTVSFMNMYLLELYETKVHIVLIETFMPYIISQALLYARHSLSRFNLVLEQDRRDRVLFEMGKGAVDGQTLDLI